MQVKKSKLIINFLKGKVSFYPMIKLLNVQYSTKEPKLEIDISQLFENSKEKKIVELELFKNNPLEKTIKYKMNLFYGTNKAYLLLSVKKHILVEYSFIDYEGVFYKEQELKEYDGNGFIKRIVLINCPTEIQIKNKIFSFTSYMLEYVEKGENSFEICECNYSNRKFATKVIKKEKEIMCIDLLKEQQKQLLSYFNDLKKLIDKKVPFPENYVEIFNNYKFPDLNINLCHPKNKLAEKFQTQDDYYLIYLYFIRSSINPEKINVREIFDIYNEITLIYNKYLEKDDLLMYEKVMLFCSHVIFYMEKSKINKYKCSNIKYINKRVDISNNSVYGLSFQFLKDFIIKLNEKSYLFYPLLMLDNGEFNESNEIQKNTIYGYNRESCDVIKSHLEDLIPDVFFEYDDPGNEVYQEYGFNYKGYNVIFLNRCLLLKGFQKDPHICQYKKDEAKLFKHYSIRISKTIMHEGFGHNKINYNHNEKVDSPSKFYNRNKLLVEMKKETFYDEIGNNKDVEYFKALKNYEKGESGKFFEYFFGIFDGQLILDYIYKIDDIGKLFDNVDYFVKENLSELQKYIINKYKIQHYKLTFKEEATFEKENESMEKLIFEHEKQLPPFKVLGNIFEIKKREENFISKQNLIFYEDVKDEGPKTKGYTYYKNKLFKEKNVKNREQYIVPYWISLHTS